MRWKSIANRITDRRSLIASGLFIIALATSLYLVYQYRFTLELTRLDHEQARFAADAAREAAESPSSSRSNEYERQIVSRIDDQEFMIQEGRFRQSVVFIAIALVGIGLALLGYLRSSFSLSLADKSASNARTSLTFDAVRTTGQSISEDKSTRNESSLSPDRDTTQRESLAERRERMIALLFETTQQRLRAEIEALGRRSNLNLVVGVLITIIAVGVLTYLVNKPHEEFTTLPKVLGFYLPRITTTALIETFAYFFLRLYKANLAEVKYYQNERTMFAAVEIAWMSSAWPDLDKTTASITQRILKIDRNLIPRVAGDDSALDQSALLEMLKGLSKTAAHTTKPRVTHSSVRS